MVLNSVVPGKVVVLASGGPKMTAMSAEQDNITCAWFIGETLKTGVFPICALREHSEITRIELVGVSPSREYSNA